MFPSPNHVKSVVLTVSQQYPAQRVGSTMSGGEASTRFMQRLEYPRLYYSHYSTLGSIFSAAFESSLVRRRLCFSWWTSISGNHASMAHTVPLIDEEPSNPFYCPDIPAISFADSLRRQLYKDVGSPRQTSTPYRIGRKLLLSYARNLDRALVPRKSDSTAAGASLSHVDVATNADSRVSLWDDSSTLASYRGRGLLFSRGSLMIRHKGSGSFSGSSSPSFSDIIGCYTQHAKSYQSVHESSFEVELRSEKLNYSRLDSAPSPVDRLESVLRRQVININHQAPSNPAAAPTLYDVKLRIQDLESETIEIGIILTYY